MFTGITEHTGKIESIEGRADGGRLRVSLAGADAIAGDMKLGDSIAVNGCCLTVVEFDARAGSASGWPCVRGGRAEHSHGNCSGKEGNGRKIVMRAFPVGEVPRAGG